MYAFSSRRFLRELPLAALIGAGIGGILWFGHLQGSLFFHLVISAYIGVFIYSVATLLMLVVARRIDHSAGTPLQRSFVLGVAFFLAGAIGWTGAFVTLPLITLGSFAISTPKMHFAIVFAGSLGVVVGLLNHYHLRLRSSLEKSISRLRDQEIVDKELELARTIQQRLLPPEHLIFDDLEVVSVNLPAHGVAGDFYDVIERKDGRILLVVADVAGKGIAASLIMAGVKTTIGFLASSGSAADVMNALNERLVIELGPRQFVAMTLALYDRDTGVAEICNAGLPDPFLIRDSGAVTVDARGPRLPVGVRPGTIYEAVQVGLSPGEALFIHTDGLPEGASADGSQVGYARLEQVIASQRPRSREGLASLIEAIVASANRDDDCTAQLLVRKA